jgi:hypothetical protein
MKVSNGLILGILILISASCTIKGSFSGLFSDYKKVNKNNPNLLKQESNQTAICNAVYSDSCKVLVLKSEDLKKCIDASDKVVLYLWSPHCSSPYCYGLDRVQAYCTEKGLKLYAVAAYYDTELMAAYYELEFPIVGIDVKKYGNRLTPVYTKKFLAELSIFREKDNSDRYFYLEKGKFIRSFRALEEVQ